jgi:hypothetical protein
MKGRVVHCKKEKYDIYIGRPGPWGNPFTMRSEEDRQRVLARYKEWLEEQIEIGGIKKEDIISLRDKTLGCWCAPRPCHGDILLRAAERLERDKFSK